MSDSRLHFGADVILSGSEGSAFGSTTDSSSPSAPQNDNPGGAEDA